MRQSAFFLSTSRCIDGTIGRSRLHSHSSLQHQLNLQFWQSYRKLAVVVVNDFVGPINTASVAVVAVSIVVNEMDQPAIAENDAA